METPCAAPPQGPSPAPGAPAADHMGRLWERIPAPRARGRGCTPTRRWMAVTEETEGEARGPGPLHAAPRSRGASVRGAPTLARHDAARFHRGSAVLASSLTRQGVELSVGAHFGGVSAEPRNRERRPGGWWPRDHQAGWGEPRLQTDKPPKHFRCFPRGRERARKRSKMAASQPLRMTSYGGVRKAFSARPPSGAERRPHHVTPSWRYSPSGRRRRHLLDGGSSCNQSSLSRWRFASKSLQGPPDWTLTTG